MNARTLSSTRCITCRCSNRRLALSTRQHHWSAGTCLEFATLRRLIEARMAKRGKREFVQVLRLLEVFRPEDVLAGIREAIARGAIGFDAVKHLVLCRVERRPPRLDLTVYPYLPRATVAMTSAKAYLDLLAGASS